MSLVFVGAVRQGDTVRVLLEWSDARTAALFLKPCTPKHLNEELGTMLRRKTANRPGTITARSGGWLYLRHDLERVRAIMDSLGAKPLLAARLFHAMKELNERQMMPYLLETLDSTLQQETIRKFQ